MSAGRLSGRILALAGIALMALNTRTAVSSLSPIEGTVGKDLPLSGFALDLIGMLPPIAFAVAALAAPALARRIGLELGMVLACVAIVAGSVLRGLAWDDPALIGGSIVALAGAGVTNVLLPPAVKKYFPNRIGLLTGLYVTLLFSSTALAAALAEPVTAGAGWRMSLGMWAVLALVALVPWLALLLGQRRRREDQAGAAGAVGAQPAREELPAPVWLSGAARSITGLLTVSAFSTFAMYAWLPTILSEHAGTGAFESGDLLALYSFIALPLCLSIPVVAARWPRTLVPIIVAGVSCIVVFCLGILIAPSPAPWLWVIFGGLGTMLFPLCLALINLRTRSTAGSVALSGFAQALAYTGGALGALTLALAHDLTGGWMLPLLLVAGVALLGLVPAATLSRTRYVEDQLAARAPAERAGAEARLRG